MSEKFNSLNSYRFFLFFHMFLIMFAPSCKPTADEQGVLQNTSSQVELLKATNKGELLHGSIILNSYKEHTKCEFSSEYFKYTVRVRMTMVGNGIKNDPKPEVTIQQINRPKGNSACYGVFAMVRDETNEEKFIFNQQLGNVRFLVKEGGKSGGLGSFTHIPFKNKNNNSMQRFDLNEEQLNGTCKKIFGKEKIREERALDQNTCSYRFFLPALDGSEGYTGSGDQPDPQENASESGGTDIERSNAKVEALDFEIGQTPFGVKCTVVSPQKRRIDYYAMEKNQTRFEAKLNHWKKACNAWQESKFKRGTGANWELMYMPSMPSGWEEKKFKGSEPFPEGL